MPPLRKIIGGSLFAYGPDANDFALETNAFAAQFGLGQTGGIAIPLQPQLGQTIDCSATLAGAQTLQFGYVDFAGQSIVKRWFTGKLNFNAGTVVVPSLPLQPIQLVVAFTFKGHLTAYPSDPLAMPAPASTFEYRLTGKGSVTVRLTEPIGAIRNLTSYFYQFT